MAAGMNMGARRTRGEVPQGHEVGGGGGGYQKEKNGFLFVREHARENPYR